MSKRAKTSSMLNYFTVVDANLKNAKYDLCSQKMSYRSTTSNLKNHMTRRHPTVNISAAGGSGEISSVSAISIIGDEQTHEQEFDRDVGQLPLLSGKQPPSL